MVVCGSSVLEGSDVVQHVQHALKARCASMVPNGRFHLVCNEGHYLQDDAGEELAARMMTFLRDKSKVTIT